MLDKSSQRPDYEAAANFIERVGVSGDPVVEGSIVTPGPLTPVEVALANVGPSTPEDHPVLRLGYPSRIASLNAPPYTRLPRAPAQAVAAQAAKLARGRSLFVVGLGSAQAPSLVGVLAFMQALPARFHPVETRTFPGLVPISVYVLSDSHGSNGHERRHA
jgi:hypothetical protein